MHHAKRLKCVVFSFAFLQTGVVITCNSSFNVCGIRGDPLQNSALSLIVLGGLRFMFTNKSAAAVL